MSASGGETLEFRRKQGLCVTCGLRPPSLNPRTGFKLLTCETCDRTAKKNRELKKKLAEKNGGGGKS